jgi:hypothetical protein
MKRVAHFFVLATILGIGLVFADPARLLAEQTDEAREEVEAPLKSKSAMGRLAEASLAMRLEAQAVVREYPEPRPEVLFDRK